MPANDLPDDTEIITTAYADRVRELFRVFAEAIYTGEPERDAVVRFRRGLASVRRAYAAAVEALNETNPG
jgi:hypothetical protein